MWIDGVPREAAAVALRGGLRRIDCVDGSPLRFHARGRARRSENLLIVKSDYARPSARSPATLPGGVALAHGLGVMEHHRARW